MGALSKNINDDFFKGQYKDIWRSFNPEGLTKAEVDFLINTCELKPGNRVLDLLCGYGRHALALARKGIEVTAIDILPEYVQEIESTSKKENISVRPLLLNVLDFHPTENYDLVTCLGNNLSFFDEADTMQLFSMISASLLKKGFFIFNTWMLTEIVSKNFMEKNWVSIGDAKVIAENCFFLSPTRIVSDSLFITSDGRTEERKSIDYLYSINETENLLTHAGLTIENIWSIPGRKKYTLGDPRAYFVARKS